MVPVSALLLMAMMPQAESQVPAKAEHVAIQAADLDRSATFYREAFGLRMIPTPLKNRRWLDLGTGMALHILDGRTAPKPSNRNEHLALHVDDLARVTAWRIHQYTYVLKRKPRRQSYFSTPICRPMLPSWTRSRKDRPRPR